MDGAEILPFGSAHLWASRAGAGWIVGKESYDDDVELTSQKAHEFVQPQRAIDAVGWRGELLRRGTRDGNGMSAVGRVGVREIERLEMFLELKRRVELLQTVNI